MPPPPERKKPTASFRWQEKAKEVQTRSSVGTLLKLSDKTSGAAGFVCKFMDLDPIAPTGAVSKYKDLEPKVRAVIPSLHTLSSVEAAASKALGFERKCRVHDPEGHGGNAILRSDAQLHAVLKHWVVREDARSSDALEALLESIRSRLGSSRAELHFQAVHALWELSCRVENHAQIDAGLLSLLASAVHSEERHVAALAAATAWLLSECDDTRARRAAAIHLYM